MEQNLKEIENLKLANGICKKLLVNSYVESYGVSHQIPFMEFISDSGTYGVSIDSDVELNPDIEVSLLSREEKMLLRMHKVNLKRIINVNCTNDGDLIIVFENDVELKILGKPNLSDASEPWQLNNNENVHSDNYISVIVGYGGAYYIWCPESMAVEILNKD